MYRGWSISEYSPKFVSTFQSPVADGSVGSRYQIKTPTLPLFLCFSNVLLSHKSRGHNILEEYLLTIPKMIACSNERSTDLTVSCYRNENCQAKRARTFLHPNYFWSKSVVGCVYENNYSSLNVSLNMCHCIIYCNSVK